MTDASPRFWTVVPDFVIADRMQAIGFKKKPPTLTQPRLMEAVDREAKWHDANTVEPVQLRLPPGEDPGWALRVEEPDFAPDYIPLGPDYVSARLRKAMAVDDAVQWLSVDMTGSTQLAKDQDYRVLRPLVTAPVLDIEAVEGRWIEGMAPTASWFAAGARNPVGGLMIRRASRAGAMAWSRKPISSLKATRSGCSPPTR
ncbi:MAG: hypothetical protein ACK5MQ_16515 [Pikeienuella sp.]